MRAASAPPPHVSDRLRCEMSDGNVTIYIYTDGGRNTDWVPDILISSSESGAQSDAESQDEESDAGAWMAGDPQWRGDVLWLI